MKAGFYSRLALDGIRKNRKLYIPYLMTCVLMVSVYYILAFLSKSDLVANMKGGGSAQMIVSLGSYVIAVFAALFLFYTNSFLIRRRKKEFGLYNVLGMNKRNIGRILFCETLIGYAVSVVVGLAAGIALSKLAELSLLNLVEAEIGYAFSVPFIVLRNTVLFFAAIFVLIYVNALRQVSFSNAIQLVRSENMGEKPPKANWVVGIAGAIILGTAYWIAVEIEQPMAAIFYFFIAVIMVIVATYLLFIAGSVLLCRILQRNKGFYYKAKNFVSVSSMTYRMKRNGAGLASICILLTMVLVMLSSSACLYFGKDAAISARYPRDICAFANWYGFSESDGEIAGKMNAAVEDVLSQEGIGVDSARAYYEYSITGYLEDSHVSVSPDVLNDLSFENFNRIVELHFIQLEDYNRIQGENEALAPGEAILCAVKADDIGDIFSVEDVKLNVVKRVNHDVFNFDGATLAEIYANVFVVVDDIDAYAMKFLDKMDFTGVPLLRVHWFYQFDTDADLSDQIEIARAIEASVRGNVAIDESINPVTFYVDCHDAQRGDFYGTFGGLFFIGIMLSIVFVVAAALIIYYKQISEGYEDQSRFEIMQKVGMTKNDIRRSINAQMLTVFFLPIGFAVLHLAFAFPVVYKLLMLFGVFYLPLLVATTGVSVVICLILYVIIYRITSNAYFSIVTDAKA
jgi:putative ABC transport system permease protein